MYSTIPKHETEEQALLAAKAKGKSLRPLALAATLCFVLGATYSTVAAPARDVAENLAAASFDPLAVTCATASS